MVIAVAVVRMMQVTVHQIADMVAMRHRLVTAAGAMDVIGRVAAANVARSTTVGVFGGNFDGVMFHGAAVLLVVEVTVVQIVDVVAVFDGGVAAAFTVIVIVVVAIVIVCHKRASPGFKDVLPLDL